MKVAAGGVEGAALVEAVGLAVVGAEDVADTPGGDDAELAAEVTAGLVVTAAAVVDGGLEVEDAEGAAEVVVRGAVVEVVEAGI